MKYRIDDINGGQYLITSLSDLESLIQCSLVKFDTIVFDEEAGAIKELFEIPEYKDLINKDKKVNSTAKITARPVNNHRFLNIILHFLYAILNSCAFTLLFVSSLYSAPSEDLKGAVIYSLERPLITAGIIMVLSFLLFKIILHKKYVIASTAFSLIFIVTAGYLFMPVSNKVFSLAKDIKDNVSLIMDIKNGKEINLEKIQSASSSDPNGIFSVIQELQSAFLDSQDVSGLDLSSMFDISNYKSIQDIDSTKSHLSKVERSLENYESDIKNKSSEVTNKINNSNIPPVIKSQFIKQFSNLDINQSSEITDTFELQKDLISESEDLLNFMKSKFGSYKIDGSTISFKSKSDIETYNRYVNNINNLADKQKELQDEYNKILDSYINNINQ